MPLNSGQSAQGQMGKETIARKLGWPAVSILAPATAEMHMTIPALHCPCSSALSQSQAWTEVWEWGGHVSQCRQSTGLSLVL